MKFHLTLDGRAVEFELSASAPAYLFSVDGAAEKQALVETPEPDIYSILIDGLSYEARVETSGSKLAVTVDGYRFEVEVRDPRAWGKESGRAGVGGVETIATLMPGKVVRVLVSAGDIVEAGQGLVVVEAMKMQNEMKASRAGRVATLTAREGAAVAAGEVLATIE